MSSGSGTNAGDITANSANSSNTAANANDTRAYNASSHVEIDGSVFKGPTTFGTPLCFEFR
jgi:hypothetical protein